MRLSQNVDYPRGIVKAILWKKDTLPSQPWLGWPYNLMSKPWHIWEWKRCYNHYAGPTGINWACPKKTGFDGHPTHGSILCLLDPSFGPCLSPPRKHSQLTSQFFKYLLYLAKRMQERVWSNQKILSLNKLKGWLNKIRSLLPYLLLFSILWWVPKRKLELNRKNKGLFVIGALGSCSLLGWKSREITKYQSR